jgi:hypothetical protein
MTFMNAIKQARFLGWFSIGLGVTELLGASGLAKFLGTKRRDLIMVFGLREIAAGVAILSYKEPPAATIWARVGGDAMDLAALGAKATPDNPKLANVAVALGAVVGATVLDIICAQKLSRR